MIQEYTDDLCCCAEEINKLTKLTYLLQKKVFKSQDLTASQASTILDLFEYKELTMGELSKHEGIDLSTLSRNIQQLRKNNLIEKKRDLNDKRVCIISLTKEGEKRALEIKKILLERMQQIVCQISHDSFQQIFLAITLLIEVLESSERVESES